MAIKKKLSEGGNRKKESIIISITVLRDENLIPCA